MTGAGMMDCKKALTENDGDLDRSVAWLRTQGLAAAAKRAGRAANEGVVHSYIHQGGRLGVLVEVNCETDFVARSDPFQEFVKRLALHIAAMKPLFVKADDVPADHIAKERAIYVEQAKERPEAAREKIVEGKLAKHLREICLVDQEYVLHQGDGPAPTIEEMRAATSSELGENVQIRRFVIFQLGA
ncbi:MAG: translation elongation factor Ts [Actinobacteria bacterium]|nr:translation elongation factor Ts [Actinomycetota bacterium]